MTRRLRFLPILCLTAWLAEPERLQAQEDQEKERPTWNVVVPMVVNVRGIGDVEWRTELGLRNDTAGEVDVALTLSGVAGQPFFFTTLASGESLTFADPIAETFGLVRAMSPLLITTAGARSVTVTASIVGYAGAQRLRPQPLSPIFGPAYSTLRSLGGLEVSDSVRTNIGLVNYGETPASFSLAVQRIVDRNVATSTLIVPAQSVLQLPLQGLFPLIGEGSGLTVVVDASSNTTFCYASMLNNETQQPRLVLPAPINARPFGN